MQFYEGQAKIYDATRNGLLRSRKTMLNLSAAHLRVLRESNPKKRLVWIDIGGGTGMHILDNVYIFILIAEIISRLEYRDNGEISSDLDF